MSDPALHLARQVGGAGHLVKAPNGHLVKTRPISTALGRCYPDTLEITFVGVTMHSCFSTYLWGYGHTAVLPLAMVLNGTWTVYSQGWMYDRLGVDAGYDSVNGNEGGGAPYCMSYSFSKTYADLGYVPTPPGDIYPSTSQNLYNERYAADCSDPVEVTFTESTVALNVLLLLDTSVYSALGQVAAAYRLLNVQAYGGGGTTWRLFTWRPARAEFCNDPDDEAAALGVWLDNMHPTTPDWHNHTFAGGGTAQVDL